MNICLAQNFTSYSRCKIDISGNDSIALHFDENRPTSFWKRDYFCKVDSDFSKIIELFDEGGPWVLSIESIMKEGGEGGWKDGKVLKILDLLEKKGLVIVGFRLVETNRTIHFINQNPFIPVISVSMHPLSEERSEKQTEVFAYANELLSNRFLTRLSYVLVRDRVPFERTEKGVFTSGTIGDISQCHKYTLKALGYDDKEN